MRPRKRVLAPKLREGLRFEFKYFKLSHNFYHNTVFFSPFNVLVLFSLSCLGLGFLRPVYWTVGFATPCFLLYVYLRTQRLAHGVSLQRRIAKVAREKSYLEVEYVISNATGFALAGLFFVEDFDGVQEGYYPVRVQRSVRPESRLIHRQKVLLNAGMGVKAFGPLRIQFKDAYGLFTFEVHYLEGQEVEVHPLIEAVPDLKTSVSPDAVDFGVYEINKRGDSNLFIGVREYRHGDPVKLINWKLTQKSQRVLVNEFEKNTSSFVTILLDLSLNHQMGAGEISTWEWAKDLALGLAANELRKHNLVQVITQGLFVPFGTGEAQLTFIERHFTHHELANSGAGPELARLSELPNEGQIYFVCPLLTSPPILATIEHLLRLRHTGQRVTVITLDPYEELRRAVKGKMRLGIMEMERFVGTEFDKHETRLRSLGLEVVRLKIQRVQNFRDQLFRAAPHLIEGK